jgi:hypothetical protein
MRCDARSRPNSRRQVRSSGRSFALGATRQQTGPPSMQQATRILQSARDALAQVTQPQRESFDFAGGLERGARPKGAGSASLLLNGRRRQTDPRFRQWDRAAKRASAKSPRDKALGESVCLSPHLMGGRRATSVHHSSGRGPCEPGADSGRAPADLRPGRASDKIRAPAQGRHRGARPTDSRDGDPRSRSLERVRRPPGRVRRGDGGDPISAGAPAFLRRLDAATLTPTLQEPI